MPARPQRLQTAAIPSTIPPGLLTVAQAVQQAGVSRWTIAGWIDGGYLPSVLINHRRYLRPADLAAAQTRQHLDGVVPAWRRDPRRAGWRLRHLREAAGLTQLELAALTGLAHEAIRGWNGNGVPPWWKPCASWPEPSASPRASLSMPTSSPRWG